MTRPPPRSPLSPPPPLFKSKRPAVRTMRAGQGDLNAANIAPATGRSALLRTSKGAAKARSEEHTSELQSRLHLVCRLLLEKKKNKSTTTHRPTECKLRSHIY